MELPGMSRYGRKVLQRQFHCLRFARTGFSAKKNTLIRVHISQRSPSTIRHSITVRERVLYIKVVASFFFKNKQRNFSLFITYGVAIRRGNGSGKYLWRLAYTMEASCEGWLTKAPFQYWSAKKIYIYILYWCYLT